LLWGVKQSLGASGMDTTGFPAHWVGYLRNILRTYTWRVAQVFSLYISI
jgi:hypothetical protein